MENNTAKKKFNAVDIVIAVLLVVCILAVGLRFFVIKATPDPITDPDIPTQKYYLSYLTRDHRYSVAKYLAEGTDFRFYDTNNPFGETIGNVESFDAEKWYYNSKGEYVSTYNHAQDEIAGRCDIKGQFLVEGKYTDEGVFVIKDSEKVNIVLNKPFLGSGKR